MGLKCLKNFRLWVTGDNVGILLRGIDKSVIERGRVLCEPKSVCSLLNSLDWGLCFKERGDRHTPF